MAAFFALFEKLLVAVPGKTYLGALGLLAGVIYNVVVTKDYQAALVLAGNILAVLGIRTAFDKQTKEVSDITHAVAAKQNQEIEKIVAVQVNPVGDAR